MTMSLIASGTRSWRRCNWGDEPCRACFMHETNTFSRVKTDMALIRRRDFHLENEIPQAFRGTRSALGATFEAADKYGWSLVHPVSANPNPSGIVTDDAFEQIVGMISRGRRQERFH